MNQEHRNQLFGQFVKLTWGCERHPEEVANMLVTKEDVEPRGLICAMCLSPKEGQEKGELEPKSLKLMLLQIHQSCSSLQQDVGTSAFVDHHINLIRGVAKTHFKDIEQALQTAITAYFQKTKELLNGRYFQDFYLAIQHLLALHSQSPQEPKERREATQWRNKLLNFIFGFEKLAG
jgi:hypothetical protein